MSKAGEAVRTGEGVEEEEEEEEEEEGEVGVVAEVEVREAVEGREWKGECE